MRRILTLSVLCIVSLILAGAAPSAEPQSKPARTALDRYSAARAKIDADYQAKLANLNRNLAADLTAAMKAATKAGDLDEANAIKVILEQTDRPRIIVKEARYGRDSTWTDVTEISRQFVQSKSLTVPADFPSTFKVDPIAGIKFWEGIVIVDNTWLKVHTWDAKPTTIEIVSP